MCNGYFELLKKKYKIDQKPCFSKNKKRNEVFEYFNKKEKMYKYIMLLYYNFNGYFCELAFTWLKIKKSINYAINKIDRVYIDNDAIIILNLEEYEMINVYNRLHNEVIKKWIL